MPGLGANAGRAQAIGNGFLGKDRIMLLARKPLFLCSSYDLAIEHKGCSAVMVEGRNYKNAKPQMAQTIIYKKGAWARPL